MNIVYCQEIPTELSKTIAKTSPPHDLTRIIDHFEVLANLSKTIPRETAGRSVRGSARRGKGHGSAGCRWIGLPIIQCTRIDFFRSTNKQNDLSLSLKSFRRMPVFFFVNGGPICLQLYFEANSSNKSTRICSTNTPVEPKTRTYHGWVGSGRPAERLGGVGQD